MRLFPQPTTAGAISRRSLLAELTLPGDFTQLALTGWKDLNDINANLILALPLTIKSCHEEVEHADLGRHRGRA